MGRGPCTFKKSDVTRAVEAVIAAGIAVQKVEIDCEAKKIISGKPPEEPNTSAEWDDLSCATARSTCRASSTVTGSSTRIFDVAASRGPYQIAMVA
jgi:hypothetical protein